jgi:hypothetical protein
VRRSRKLLSPSGPLGRFVAAGAAALVLLLAVLAASPTLHAWVHGQSVAQAQAGHGDDDCVITQFSHGLTTPAAALALVAFLGLISGLARPCAVGPLPAPRFWLPPVCGPPAA